jgi:cellulose biosynthesis protein BcsQ
MQIALWSDGSGGVGTTTVASVMATIIAANYNYKTLITHSLTKDLSMEYYLLKENERTMKGFVGESNVEGLFRLINNGKLTSQMIPNYCFSLFSHSNLDFLNTNKLFEASESFCHNYMYLLYLAKQFYDVIVVDLNVEMNHALFDKVLQESDVFIVVGNQNRHKLTSMISEVNKHKELIRKANMQTHLIINQYNAMSSMGFASFTKNLKIKKPKTLPYQVELIDMCNKNDLVDFTLRQLYNKRSGDFDLYLKTTQDIVSGIMKEFVEVGDNVISY